MKLKKLMKHIKDDTYIKIGVYGICQCSCKKKDAENIVERYNDYTVISICAGSILLSTTMENVDAIEIFLERRL